MLVGVLFVERGPEKWWGRSKNNTIRALPTSFPSTNHHHRADASPSAMPPKPKGSATAINPVPSGSIHSPPSSSSLCLG